MQLHDLCRIIFGCVFGKVQEFTCTYILDIVIIGY